MIEAERICIIRLGALGGVGNPPPALDALRASYPDAHIAWLVEARWQDILPDPPRLDEIAEAARMLNLDCTVEEKKAHPAAWWEKQGRVLVKKTDAPKSSILYAVGSKMKELRSTN